MKIKKFILCLAALMVFLAPATAFARSHFSFSLNLFNPPRPIVRPCPPPVVVYPCYPYYHHHVWYYGPYYPGCCCR